MAIDTRAAADGVPSAIRCPIDPKHPATLIATVICALLCVVDAGLIVLMSVDAGPWDILEDPPRALSVVQRLDAAVMRDDIASGYQPLPAADLVLAGEDAAVQWNDLRDEAIELSIVDDPSIIDEMRDETIAVFDRGVAPPELPILWRITLGAISASIWALPILALLWLLWRRAEVIRPCPSGLSLPIADGASGISAAVIVMGSLSAWTLLLGSVVQFLPMPAPLASYLSASALLLWIVPTLFLMWLCAAWRNGGVLPALGLTAGASRANTLQCVGTVLFLLGLQEIILAVISFLLPDLFAAGAWWEGVDEILAFGPLPLAFVDTLDAVVGAPIVEEIIFRGLLFGALVRSMGFTAAAVISSVVFAAVHGYGLEGTIAVTVTGSLLCWVYWRTGRLWTAMLAHGVHNALVTLPMWAARALVDSGQG